jgi:hypothetical protein
MPLDGDDIVLNKFVDTSLLSEVRIGSLARATHLFVYCLCAKPQCYLVLMDKVSRR